MYYPPTASSDRLLLPYPQRILNSDDPEDCPPLGSPFSFDEMDTQTLCESENGQPCTVSIPESASHELALALILRDHSELLGKYRTLQSENNHLQSQYSQLQSDFTQLRGCNAELEVTCGNLRKANYSLQNTCMDIGERNRVLEEDNSEVTAEVECLQRRACLQLHLLLGLSICTCPKSSPFPPIGDEIHSVG
jgi:hypothetical protein